MPDAVLDAVLSAPWAISEAGLQRVLAVASRMHVEPEALGTALEQRGGEPLDNSRHVTVRDGVATIPLRGVMVQRGGLFASISGAASYATIAQDLRTAVDDPSVHAILLQVDSPGGEVAGCHELWQQLMAIRGVKPIEAYVGGDGCSAAYWLASACDRIHVADTAVVGSLGVRMSAIDDTRALRQQGYRRIEIVSSQTPQKALDPAEPDGRTRVQRMVDALAAVFLTSVAQARGVAPDRVAAQYGAGDVFVGADAVSAGLVDALGTYEAVHAALAAAAATPRPTAPVLVPAARAGRSPASNAARLTEPRMATKKSTRRSTTTAARKATPSRADRTRALKARAAKDDREKYDAENEEEDEEDVVGTTDTPPDPDEEETATETEDDEEEDVDASEEEEMEASDDEEEDVDASEEEDDDEMPAGRKGKAAARRLSPLAKARRAGASAERARILGILKYQGRASAELLSACIADPTCTAAHAAQRILDAGPHAGSTRLRRLAADERGVAGASLTAHAPADTGAQGLRARIAAGYERARPGAIRAASRLPSRVGRPA